MTSQTIEMETLTSAPIELIERTSPPAQAPPETIDDQYYSLLANSNDRTVEMFLGPQFARETTTNPGIAAWWRRVDLDVETERLIRPTDQPVIPELLPQPRPLAAPIVPVIPGRPEAVRPTPELAVAEQTVATHGLARHRQRPETIRGRVSEWFGDAVATVHESLQTSVDSGRLSRMKEALRPSHRRVAMVVGALALGGVLAYTAHDAPISNTATPAAAAGPGVKYGPAMPNMMGPTREKPVVSERLVKPIDLNPKHVKESQRILPGGGGNKINLPGSEKRVRSDSLSKSERIDIIEQKLTLGEAAISVEGYEAFVPTMVDLTKKVPKKMSNYNGHNWRNPRPSMPDGINHYVWHFTATPRKANSYDGMKFAGTMQNSGALAIQDYLSRPGTFYELTNNRTYHVRNHNSESMGVEIAAACQEDVEPIQYTNAVYGTVNFLLENGYITKDTKSVRKVVDSVLRGHRELNPNGHHDFPGLVMKEGRRMTTNLLIDMGYGEGAAKRA